MKQSKVVRGWHHVALTSIVALGVGMLPNAGCGGDGDNADSTLDGAADTTSSGANGSSSSSTSGSGGSSSGGGSSSSGGSSSGGRSSSSGGSSTSGGSSSGSSSGGLADAGSDASVPDAVAPETCEQIAAAYVTEFAKALHCDLDSNVKQCGVARPSKLACGCTGYVNAQYVENLDQVAARYAAKNCNVACQDAVCEKATGGQCVAGPDEPVQGRCKTLYGDID